MFFFKDNKFAQISVASHCCLKGRGWRRRGDVKICSTFANPACNPRLGSRCGRHTFAICCNFVDCFEIVDCELSIYYKKSMGRKETGFLATLPY